MPASPRLQALLRAKEKNEIGNFLSAVLGGQEEVGGISADRYMEIMDRSPYGTGIPMSVGYDEDSTMSPLDMAAIVSSAIPVVGDVTGLAADADMYARDPESRNMINYLLSAAGAIPLIPAASQVRKTIKAYHGSPHDFDEFSTEAIGTGEGAQMYGHGLYFAESEKVAKEYRDQLTQRDIDYEEWLMGKYKEAESNQDYSRMDMYERAMMHDTPADFRDTASDLDYDEDYRGLAEEIAEEIEEYGPNLGRMYEVELSVTDRELLDWDNPVSSQSEEVRTAIKKAKDKFKYKLTDADKKVFDELMADYSPEDLKKIDLEGKEIAKTKTGRDELYDLTNSIEANFNQKVKEINNTMSQIAKEIDDISVGHRNFLPANEQKGFDLLQRYDDLMTEKMSMNRNFPSIAAKTLNEEGVKGVKYADAFTRHKPNGKTFNYVIFDDRIVDIAKKYGVAVPIAAVMLSEITGDDPKSLYDET